MRSELLTAKLSKQVFTRNRLIATFKKFYGRHSVLVDRFWSQISSLTCFLRRFTVGDLFLCNFTAKTFTDIDV